MARLSITTLFAGLIASFGCGAAPTELPVRASEVPLADRVAADGLSATRVGTLQFYADTVRIEMPDRANRGVPLDIYVSTYGGGCVGSDTTVTAVQGLRATVVPYQRVSTNPNLACPSILLIDRRRARIVFETPGTATVRVIGREEPSGRLFAVERRIAVR